MCVYEYECVCYTHVHVYFRCSFIKMPHMYYEHFSQSRFLKLLLYYPSLGYRKVYDEIQTQYNLDYREENLH